MDSLLQVQTKTTADQHRSFNLIYRECVHRRENSYLYSCHSFLFICLGLLVEPSYRRGHEQERYTPYVMNKHGHLNSNSLYNFPRGNMMMSLLFLLGRPFSCF